MECDVIDRCKVDSSWRSPTAVFVSGNGSPYSADFYGMENFGSYTAFYGAPLPSMVSPASFGHENGAIYFMPAISGQIWEGVILAGTGW